jgi:hypothetical protein
MERTYSNIESTATVPARRGKVLMIGATVFVSGSILVGIAFGTGILDAGKINNSPVRRNGENYIGCYIDDKNRAMVSFFSSESYLLSFLLAKQFGLVWCH